MLSVVLLTDDEQTRLYESWNDTLRRYSSVVNRCPPTFFTSHNRDAPRRILFTICEKEECYEEGSLSDCSIVSSESESSVPELSFGKYPIFSTLC